MMIRINLLPVRAVKKREANRQILVVFAGILFIAAVLNFVWYTSRASEASRNAARISATKAKVAELEKVIGEVNNINLRKAEVERKLGVLDTLRKGRSGPVRMLDAFSTATPKKVWVSSFTETANAVKVTGQALSHDEVAEFMRGLGNVVWTPKGMGRLIEQRRDAKTSRVELLNETAAVEEFPVAEIHPFFTHIDLTNATQAPAVKDNPGVSTVIFNLTLQANYAI